MAYVTYIHLLDELLSRLSLVKARCRKVYSKILIIMPIKRIKICRQYFVGLFYLGQRLWFYETILDGGRV